MKLDLLLRRMLEEDLEWFADKRCPLYDEQFWIALLTSGMDPTEDALRSGTPEYEAIYELLGFVPTKKKSKAQKPQPSRTSARVAENTKQQKKKNRRWKRVLRLL